MQNPDEALEAFRQRVSKQRTPLPRLPETDQLIVREQDLIWYEPKDNPARLAPVLSAPMKSFELFLQEFVPGGASDMQRHHHEAVHYVISGHGYSEIGDRRYDWDQGDFVCVPPMMWHRHYNGSETEPVRMLLVENSRLLESLGLNFRESAGLITFEELSKSRAKDSGAGP